MRGAFVVDPLDRLDVAVDTSIGLMHAVQERGGEVWVVHPDRLEAVNGRARALARRIELAPTTRLDRRWSVPTPWYVAEPARHVWLDTMTAIFLRCEPPLDEVFTTSTLILDLVDPTTTVMVNDPRGLRACSEHLFPLRFPDLIPPTVVTADPVTIRGFLAEHRVAVVKPVDGFSGRGVLRLDRCDANLSSLIELATGRGTRAVIIQPFLRDVAAGNKRIVVLGGEPVAAVYRFPGPGDFRIGDPSAVAPITDRDRQICARLAPELNRCGIYLAGLDVIGPHLIEVNVTSVGALRKADALGCHLCADVVAGVVRRTAVNAA